MSVSPFLVVVEIVATFGFLSGSSLALSIRDFGASKVRSALFFVLFLIFVWHFVHWFRVLLVLQGLVAVAILAVSFCVGFLLSWIFRRSHDGEE